MTLDLEAVEAHLTYRDDLLGIEWCRETIGALVAEVKRLTAERDAYSKLEVRRAYLEGFKNGDLARQRAQTLGALNERPIIPWLSE